MTARDRAWLGALALVFAASTALAVIEGEAMSAAGGMDMPGGWSMSMTWMRMPGQSWPGATLMFLGMWTVMMVAMMLPVLAPVLWLRRTVTVPTLQLAAAYFAAWILSGAVAYPFGAALAGLAMRAPGVAHAVPMLAGAGMLLAASLQFSAWKRRQLDCCRQSDAVPTANAWRQGWRLGWRCVQCCAPITALLYIVGVMEPAAMALATLAIAAERLLPAGVLAARVSGAVMLLGGAITLLRAAMA